MIKKILVSACLLLSLVSLHKKAHRTLFMVGDGFKGTLENRSMAGVAVEQDSIHMNIQNPASYANFSYNFTLGGTYATATLKNATESKLQEQR
jgi:hypothetical protein